MNPGKRIWERGSVGLSGAASTAFKEINSGCTKSLNGTATWMNSALHSRAKAHGTAHASGVAPTPTRHSFRSIAVDDRIEAVQWLSPGQREGLLFTASGERALHRSTFLG